MASPTTTQGPISRLPNELIMHVFHYLVRRSDRRGRFGTLRSLMETNSRFRANAIEALKSKSVILRQPLAIIWAIHHHQTAALRCILAAMPEAAEPANLLILRPMLLLSSYYHSTLHLVALSEDKRSPSSPLNFMPALYWLPVYRLKSITVTGRASVISRTVVKLQSPPHTLVPVSEREEAIRLVERHLLAIRHAKMRSLGPQGVDPDHDESTTAIEFWVPDYPISL